MDRESVLEQPHFLRQIPRNICHADLRRPRRYAGTIQPDTFRHWFSLDHRCEVPSCSPSLKFYLPRAPIHSDSNRMSGPSRQARTASPTPPHFTKICPFTWSYSALDSTRLRTRSRVAVYGLCSTILSATSGVTPGSRCNSVADAVLMSSGPFLARPSATPRATPRGRQP